MNNDGSCEWGFDTSADEVGKISFFWLERWQFVEDRHAASQSDQAQIL